MQEKANKFLPDTGTYPLSTQETKKIACDKQSANETLERLQRITNSIAHELKTPLAGIHLAMSSSVETINSLINYYEATESKENIHLVKQERVKQLKAMWPLIEHQLENIKNIIDLHLHSIQHETFDIRTFTNQSMMNIINKVLAYYPFAAHQRSLIHMSDAQDFIFWGEPHLMTHVFYNLIKNALYSIKEAGKGAISIMLDTDAHYHYVYFKDTALGMSPEVAKKAFETFYTRSRDGTGLGLPFCQSVMDAFKGDITCQSEEGRYALFILRFPKIIGERT